MTRPLQSPGDLPLPKWVAASRHATLVVSDLQWGSRERALSECASLFEISVQTLRRSISALKFAESFKLDEGIDLLGQPLNAVEDIKRWAARDSASAKLAAEKLAGGGVTVRELRNQEKSARPNNSSGAAADPKKIKRIDEAEAYYRSSYPDYNLLRKSLKRFALQPDIMLLSDFELPSIGSVVFESYERAEDAQKRMNEILIRALALCHIYNRVQVIALNEDHARLVYQWLRDNGIHGNALEIFSNLIISR